MPAGAGAAAGSGAWARARPGRPAARLSARAPRLALAASGCLGLRAPRPRAPRPSARPGPRAPARPGSGPARPPARGRGRRAASAPPAAEPSALRSRRLRRHRRLRSRGRCRGRGLRRHRWPSAAPGRRAAGAGWTGCRPSAARGPEPGRVPVLLPARVPVRRGRRSGSVRAPARPRWWPGSVRLVRLRAGRRLAHRRAAHRGPLDGGLPGDPRRRAGTDAGLRAEPSTRVSKCRWGPVQLPVQPT